jgi:threonine/homoserine/homoserine lactone efflux protein
MLAFIFATIFYAFSMSITPGPTNIIMMSTGLNYGFKSTLAFATGATVGFISLVLIVALGFGEVMTENDELMQILSYIGAMLIAYMGYQIAFPVRNVEETEYARPSFLQGALLQWINPKSWIACLAGVSGFNLAVGGERLLVYVIFYMIVGYGCVLAWGLAGSKISVFLKDYKKLRLFNFIMGGSLLLVAIYLAFLDKGTL